MLSHQRVVLDVNFAGVLSGTAYLTINPTNPALRTIYLHASPLLQIRGVTLSSPHPSDPLLVTPASYTLSQPFTPLPTREPPLDIKSHTEIKRKTWAALGERDEGELAISVSGGWVRVVPGERDTMTLAPIEIKIDYRLAIGSDVVEGIVFEQGDDKVGKPRRGVLIHADTPHVPLSYDVQLGSHMDTLRRQSMGEMYLGARVYRPYASGGRRGCTSSGSQQWRAHRAGGWSSMTKLTADHAPTFALQDDLLLPPIHPYIRSAHPVCRGALRDDHSCGDS